MTERPAIDVKPQVQLSLEKSFKFCLKGITYRLFRSTLTLAVVVVAVAFFMVLLSEGFMVRSVGDGVRGQVKELREADALLAHVFHQHSIADLSAKFAAVKADQERIAEFGRVAGLEDQAVKDLGVQCNLEQRYLRFFESISAGKRVVLVKKSKGREIFSYLQDPEAWQGFQDALANMRSVRLPTDLATLQTFLSGYSQFIDQLKQVRSSWIATAAKLQKELDGLTKGEDVAAWMAAASDEEVEQWRELVTAAGFMLDREKMARIREVLKVSAWEDQVARTLNTPAMRSAWKKEFLTNPVLEEKMLMLEDTRAAEVLDGSFSEEQLAAISSRFARRKHLRDLVAKLPVQRVGVEESGFLDGRQVFLIVISFLVCMVGIANAMLMAITERFREIATMKCLGATDGFILKQFLIEAAIQGLVGGSCGMLIGLLIAVLKGFLTFGGTVLAFFPAMAIFLCCVFTVIIGVLLAMLASVYPSRAAATMAPMEAMRVE